MTADFDLDVRKSPSANWPIIIIAGTVAVAAGITWTLIRKEKRKKNLSGH